MSLSQSLSPRFKIPIIPRIFTSETDGVQIFLGMVIVSQPQNIQMGQRDRVQGHTQYSVIQQTERVC
jgi:hypothetical protein